MARMHSRAKGRSGSTKPSVKTAPSWEIMDKAELEMLVLKMAKEGKHTSQIGLILRDVYGVPDVSMVLGVKLAKFLTKNGIVGKVPEDLQSLMKRAFNLRKHFEQNRQDMDAKKGIIFTDSKINRLVKYYKERGVLEATFRYRPSELNLYLE